MNFLNPTPLRIGMQGTLLGRRYRVAGRVVLSAELEGQTYYWQEFNLVSFSGETATLVFEPDDVRGAWRLFALFEPRCPMTATDAAARKVGDRFQIEGSEVRITLVDESRVCHIEGEAPEGVELGDVANYFNAEGSGTLIVVSWTGEEVECYRGKDVSEATVRSAFNLPTVAPTGLSRSLANSKSAVAPVLWVTITFLVGVFGFGAWALLKPKMPSPTVTLPAPVLPTTLGRTWKVIGAEYLLQQHSVVEIATVSQRYERHEFELVEKSDGQKRGLLVKGYKPGRKDWVLFTPIQGVEPLSPQQAAAKRLGERLALDGRVFRVSELFRCSVRRTLSAELPDSRSGSESYGFAAEDGAALLLVRWNEKELAIYRGRALSSSDVFSGNP